MTSALTLRGTPRVTIELDAAGDAFVGPSREDGRDVEGRRDLELGTRA